MQELVLTMSILKYMHVQNTKIGIYHLKEEGYAPDLLLLLELVFYVICISTRMPAALYSGIYLHVACNMIATQHLVIGKHINGLHSHAKDSFRKH